MSSIDHKEIQIKLLATQSVDVIERWIVAGRAGSYSCRKALKQLKRQKEVSKELVQEFERMLQDAGFCGASGKPTTGETRRYKVQDSQRGTSYIRLPVDAIGLKPGDVAEAEFFMGEVRVKPVESDAQALDTDD